MLWLLLNNVKHVSPSFSKWLPSKTITETVECLVKRNAINDTDPDLDDLYTKCCDISGYYETKTYCLFCFKMYITIIIIIVIIIHVLIILTFIQS